MDEEKIKKARKFCNDVRKLAQEYNLPFFVVTEGASATNNNGTAKIIVEVSTFAKISII